MSKAWIIISSCLISGLISCNKYTDQSKGKPWFDWEQSYMGGGGYITGMIQDPLHPEILYARCDVAGVFKSINGGKSWKLINKGLTECHHQNVESIAISPFNTRILFRGSGEARDNKVFGDIHRSNDGGENWEKVTDKVDFFGNGPNRMYGERIALSPFDSNLVVAGGFKNGVYVSHDLGNNWEYSGLKGEPISCVAFHPVLENVVYVSTLSKLERKNFIFPDGSYQRPEVGRLFVSCDKGKSWILLFEKEHFGFAEIVFSKTNKNVIYVAAIDNGIQMSMDGGKTFTSIMEGLPGEADYNTLAIDPNNSGILYTAPSRRGHHNHIPLVPIYKSENNGRTWSLIKPYSSGDFKDYPSYIRTEEWIGWAISKIIVDSYNPDKLFMSNWYGVSVSEDNGNTWSGNHYKGTETVCIESIVVDPKQIGKAYVSLPDHDPFFTDDFGKNYNQYSCSSKYKNSNVFLSSHYKKDLVLFAGKVDWVGREGSAIHKSTDGGKSFEIVFELNNELTVQALKEDYHTPGRIYAYIDRLLENGAGLYRSDDYGSNWKKIHLQLPEHIRSLPHQQEWIENGLLSVVYGQQKNVCGTNQLLCLDPHAKNTIYFGEWTEGIFKTSDGGKTWKQIGKQLPFKKDTASVLVDIKADETRPGVLYAGFIREGLWRSEDAGKTWYKLFPKDNSIFNASSTVVGGYDKDEIFVASEPLYWSKSESAVYYSRDYGATWTNTYDNSFGALRWKGLGIDKKTGIVYGVTCGNGAFYAKRNNHQDSE